MFLKSAFLVLQGNLTNRKFQSGKQAKKLAERYQIQKAYERSIQEQQQGKALETVEEELEAKDMRPTLMEEHLSKRAKVESSSHSYEGRRPFDREKDVIATKKLNLQEIQHLVENAKELNSKFDKPLVQRTFL